MLSWVVPFAFCLVWIILFAPVIGLLGAGLSAFVVGFGATLLWLIGRFVFDVIAIWRNPYNLREDSDLWKYL